MAPKWEGARVAGTERGREVEGSWGRDGRKGWVRCGGEGVGDAGPNQEMTTVR